MNHLPNILILLYLIPKNDKLYISIMYCTVQFNQMTQIGFSSAGRLDEAGGLTSLDEADSAVRGCASPGLNCIQAGCAANTYIFKEKKGALT